MIWTALKQVLVKIIAEGFHKLVKLHVAWSHYCSFPFLTKHRNGLDISGWKQVSSEVKPTKGLSCSKTAGDLTCAERRETEDGSKPHCSHSRTWGYQVLLCKPSESREWQNNEAVGELDQRERIQDLAIWGGSLSNKIWRQWAMVRQFISAQSGFTGVYF